MRLWMGHPSDENNGNTWPSQAQAGQIVNLARIFEYYVTGELAERAKKQT